MIHPTLSTDQLADLLRHQGQAWFWENMPRRASGRTTAILLRALATATENPGKRVPVVDHTDYPHNHGTRQYLFDTARKYVQAMGLTHTQVIWPQRSTKEFYIVFGHDTGEVVK